MAMTNFQTKVVEQASISNKIQKPKSCPVCGSKLRQIDRHIEDFSTFKCPKKMIIKYEIFVSDESSVVDYHYAFYVLHTSPRYDTTQVIVYSTSKRSLLWIRDDTCIEFINHDDYYPSVHGKNFSLDLLMSEENARRFMINHDILG